MRDVAMNARMLVGLAMVLCLLAGSISFGQVQGPPPPPPPPRPFDALGGLRHALEEAGAPALSSDQESALIAVAKSFREALPKPGEPGQDDPIRAARRALDQAILAGDMAGAQAQANTLAGAQATLQAARIRAEAAAQVQVLNILKTNAAQYTALLQRFGSAGLPGLLRSPLGPGPAGPPPNGPGFGPGGPGPEGNAPRPTRRPPGE